ncbi:MAG: Stp1/IreP family PP2C-type Ser/Thr phosphatase [Polaromonas sp.]|nr:Stp1/IreP family PP2C-type Ser/Thr phosphatase [Polaromonas sp.]
MIYDIFTQTDPGLTRENNEDAIAVDPLTGLCVLADGMGGYNAGEVASGMATAFIKTEMARWLEHTGASASSRDVRRALEICVENANHSIFNAASSNPQYRGMGTTLVLGVFQGQRVTLGHIGDSRCYRLRGHAFQQLTKDHSLLQEQLDAGLISPEHAHMSLNRNLVTRALGVESAVQLELNEHKAEPGDLYLLCSDGLTDMLFDTDIASILLEPHSLEKKAASLVHRANEQGGRDNISVVLAQARDGGAKRGVLARLLGK